MSANGQLGKYKGGPLNEIPLEILDRCGLYEKFKNPVELTKYSTLWENYVKSGKVLSEEEKEYSQLIDLVLSNSNFIDVLDTVKFLDKMLELENPYKPR